MLGGAVAIVVGTIVVLKATARLFPDTEVTTGARVRNRASA